MVAAAAAYRAALMPPFQPNLTTDRLLLRPPTLADLDEYAPIFADPEVMRYIGDGSLRTPDRVAVSIERSRVLFERSRVGIFLAIDRGTGMILGDCFVVPVMRSGADPKNPEDRGPEMELGYRFRRSAWGRGYATEAARAVLAYALDPEGGGLDQVVAVTYPENSGSQRVLLKAGFVSRGLTDAYYDMTTAWFAALSDGAA